jgi:hypothetical protein
VSHAAGVKLSEFYDDPLRGMSEELDFGSSWQLDGWGPWKIVWLEATGELVAFNDVRTMGSVVVGGGGGNLIFDLAFEAAITGLVNRVARHANPEPPDQLRDQVTCLLVERDVERVRQRLSGWERHLPEANGLAWLLERCQVVDGS